jgi:hypothetical protein
MLYCSVRLFAWIGLDDGADCWGVIVRAGRIEFRKKLGFVVLVVLSVTAAALIELAHSPQAEGCFDYCSEAPN